jgi:hypothetical protein
MKRFPCTLAPLVHAFIGTAIALFALFGFNTGVFAINVGGFITTDTHWQLTGSPFVATSSILVDSGAKLTIDPGVEVRFGPTTGLAVVDGTLSARGTTELPITFKSNQPDEVNRWNGIQFGDKAVDAAFDGAGNYLSGSIIEHTIVEEVARHGNGSISSNSSAPFIHASTIRDNLSLGIYATQAGGLRIVGNEIRNNACTSSGCTSAGGGGLVIVYSNDVILADNEITENTGVYDGGLVISGGSNALISDNTVANNRIQYPSTSPAHGAGIFLGNTVDTMVSGNVISENVGAGSYANGVAIVGGKNVALMNNMVSENATGAGLAIRSSMGISLEGDKIVDNIGHGIRFIAGSIYDNSSAVIVSADPLNPTVILGNGGYQIFNDQQFEVVTGPLASGNVDARNVWWGTTDTSTINAGIFDFFDNSFKGIVYLDPIALSAPNAGDFNNDGIVDAADYTVWRDGLGTTYTQADYDVWKTHFGQIAGNGSLANSTVPEPATSVLLVLMLLGIAGAHRWETLVRS